MADFNFRWRLDYIGIVLAALFTLFTWRRFFRLSGSGVWLSPESVGLLAVMGVLTFDPAEFAQLLRPLEVVLLLIGLRLLG